RIFGDGLIKFSLPMKDEREPVVSRGIVGVLLNSDSTSRLVLLPLQALGVIEVIPRGFEGGLRRRAVLNEAMASSSRPLVRRTYLARLPGRQRASNCACVRPRALPEAGLEQFNLMQGLHEAKTNLSQILGFSL